MEVTIKINGKGVEITLTKAQVKQIECQNQMQKIYEYHNTSEEKFNTLYKDVSEFAKAQEIERMIVNFYNKGVQPDWNNTEQYKYYPYFNLGKNFSFNSCNSWRSISVFSAHLCFLRIEDLQEAIEVFKTQYENSRNK
jgi:hypothetical protein